MYEKTKIIFQRFNAENLIKHNNETQLERITNGKMAVLKTVVYSDANKEKVIDNQKKKTSVKKKYVKSK